MLDGDWIERSPVVVYVAGAGGRLFALHCVSELATPGFVLNHARLGLLLAEAIKPHKSRADLVQLQIRGNVADVSPKHTCPSMEHSHGKVCNCPFADSAGMLGAVGKIVLNDELVLHAGHRTLRREQFRMNSKRLVHLAENDT